MDNRQLALVVEDDSYLSDVFSKAVQKAGYAVEVVTNGKVARERLAAVAPAVVILDLHLPEVSGTDLLMEIRADERLTKTRVIVATGDPYLANNLRPMADLVLIKPVGYVQLRDLAKHLLDTDSLA